MSTRQSLREQVLAFHDAFDIPSRTTPTVPPDNEARLRAKLILEEAFEFVEAVFPEQVLQWDAFRNDAFRVMDRATPNVDLVAAADAMADIDYVVEGSRLSFGIDGAPVADEVQRSNMAKIGGPKHPVTGKKLKPPGWTPPDIIGVLREQGFKS